LEGGFTVTEVDTMLAASSLTVTERFEAKTHLKAAGLLPLGRPISAR
jgi:hypothetical protein